MAITLALPTEATASGGGTTAASYQDVIDGSLNLYSAQVKNYPVADAFTLGTDTSQEFWGLQSVTSRAGQNTARQGLLSYGIAQGTGALSRKSVVPMSRNVKEITSGNIRVGVYIENSDIILDGSFSVAGQETNALGLTFNGDGTKVYMVGSISSSIHQYSLTTAYDITGTVTLDGSFSVAGQDAGPQGLTFNGDGTKVYMIGASSSSIHQYSLTTAYDITGTVTLDGSLSVAGQDANALGLAFNDNGTKFYMVGDSSDSIHQYSLTTAYDIIGTVTVDGSFSVTGQETAPTGMTFNGDGTKVYIVGVNSDSIHQYSLTTAYDITGTVTLDGSFSVAGQDINPQGLTFNGDGTKVYIVGANSDSIYQYSLPSVPLSYDLTLSLNGTQLYTAPISGTDLGAYELVTLGATTPNIDVSGTTVATNTLVFEAQVTNVTNTGNTGIKLGFGLTGGTYATPTGNYETSTLDLLL